MIFFQKQSPEFLFKVWIISWSIIYKIEVIFRWRNVTQVAWSIGTSMCAVQLSTVRRIMLFFFFKMLVQLFQPLLVYFVNRPHFLVDKIYYWELFNVLEAFRNLYFLMNSSNLFSDYSVSVILAPSNIVSLCFFLFPTLHIVIFKQFFPPFWKNLENNPDLSALKTFSGAYSMIRDFSFPSF